MLSRQGHDVAWWNSTFSHYLKKLRASMGDVKTVRCEGYTDSRGKASANRKLAQKRANLVCKVLTGGTKVKSTVVAYGEARPKASNATAAGRAKNRRVVMFVLENPGDVQVQGEGQVQP